MKSIDGSFYKSKAWKECRAAYLSEHGLCERCLKKGLVAPAAIVHHKIYLDRESVQDPSISLNPANLEALCMTCHNQEHLKTETPRRWAFDENNELIIKHVQ